MLQECTVDVTSDYPRAPRRAENEAKISMSLQKEPRYANPSIDLIYVPPISEKISRRYFDEFAEYRGVSLKIADLSGPS